MKGSSKVIGLLNDALAAELVAAGQYFMSARLNMSRGIVGLAEYQQREAMDETKHAGLLSDRILFLEGTVAPKITASPKVGQTVTEQMQNDLALQLAASKMYNAGVVTARQEGDNGTAELLARILLDEEQHIAWLQAQLFLIQAIGEAAYVQSQLVTTREAQPATPPAAGG